MSSALFEVHTCASSYGFATPDERLLQRHAQAIADQVPGPWRCLNWEAAGQKTRLIPRRFSSASIFPIIPIEIFSDRAWPVRARAV